MMPGPGIFSSLIDAVKSRYLSGPAGASLTAGPGSVLDQHNQQIQHLAPMAPVHQTVPPSSGPYPQDLVHPAPYGSRPGEKLIDTTEMTRPLGSGFSGIKRK
jgi:hypothetical protein